MCSCVYHILAALPLCQSHCKPEKQDGKSPLGLWSGCCGSGGHVFHCDLIILFIRARDAVPELTVNPQRVLGTLVGQAHARGPAAEGAAHRAQVTGVLTGQALQARRAESVLAVQPARHALLPRVVLQADGTFAVVLASGHLCFCCWIAEVRLC